MLLCNTAELLTQKREDRDYDSDAVFVSKSGEEAEVTVREVGPA